MARPWWENDDPKESERITWCDRKHCAGQRWTSRGVSWCCKYPCRNFIGHPCNYGFHSLCLLETNPSFHQSVKNHEEDFKRLFWSASVLVIVLWRLHDEHRRGPTSRKIWPPPELAKHFDKFVKWVPFHLTLRWRGLVPNRFLLHRTVCRIHEFMKRNSETISKRIVSGYFGIRDIGKFKKYQQKLDSVALALEVRRRLL